MNHMYLQSPSAHRKAREKCAIVRTGYSRESKHRSDTAACKMTAMLQELSAAIRQTSSSSSSLHNRNASSLFRDRGARNYEYIGALTQLACNRLFDAMLLHSSYASRRCLPRSNLQLSTRLTLAGSGSIKRTWAAQESCRLCKRRAQRRSLCCRASEQSQSSTLRYAGHFTPPSHTTTGIN